MPPDPLLGTGLSLAETLATETTLTEDQAARVVLAYRQFLALQADDPGLLPPQLIGLAAWRHRRDADAWQAFCTAWPPAQTLPPLPEHPPAPCATAPTIRALRAKGLTPDPTIWPAPLRVTLARLCLPLMVAGFLLAAGSGLMPGWYQALALLIGLPLLILPRLLAAQLLPLRALARPALTSPWLDTSRI
ncbi:MAG: hypothetical protein JNN06_17125 [Gemmobacter sp.]|nr:hypothetical protein [Gemmobacter sp.]